VAVSPGSNGDIPGTHSFIWLIERFWIRFSHRALQRPTLTAALDGQPDNGLSCGPPLPPGTTTCRAERMDVEGFTSFCLADHPCCMEREKDTNDIVFTVILPVTL
jgi:hypothetical protein